MGLKEIETRLAAIAVEMNAEDADIEALTKETETLIEERNKLIAQAQQRSALLAQIAGATGGEAINLPGVVPTAAEERIAVDSPQYRDAFYAYLAGTATAEQRQILNIDGSTDGSVAASNIALPSTLDAKIWDNVHEAHPITSDITTLQTGIVLTVNKAIAVSTKAASKKDADADTEITITFDPVTLSGKDYTADIELTYAEAKMNPNGLEQFLADFISAELGDAIAADVVATMIADAGTSRKVAITAQGDLFELLKSALKLVKATNKVVYAGDRYYDLIGYRGTDGHAENLEQTLKCTIKCEPACGNKILTVDPKMYVNNEVSGIIIESDKRVKGHKVEVGGYCRCQGTMRDQRAVAYLEA